MVRRRPAAFAVAVRTSVVRSILEVTRAGPSLAILRIRRPQVVQVGGHVETEFCLVALCRQLHTEPPEVVRDDVDSSTCRAAIDQICSIGGKLRKGSRQSMVVSLLTGVPRHDFFHCQFDWLATGAGGAFRTGLTDALVGVFFLSVEGHILALTLHREFADPPGITEAKGIVHSTLLERNCFAGV